MQESMKISGFEEISAIVEDYKTEIAQIGMSDYKKDCAAINAFSKIVNCIEILKKLDG